MERLDVRTLIQNGAVSALDARVQRTVRDSTLQDVAPLRATVRGLNVWGGPGVIWFAALLFLGARILRRRVAARVGLRGLEAIAVASAASGIVKGLAGRSRPFLSPQEPWHWSFAHGWTDARYFSMPSGHTTASFAFAVAAIVATRGSARGVRMVCGVITTALAVGVAFARVYLDQHWASDVVAGGVLGALVGWLLTRWHGAHEGSVLDRVLLGDAGRS